MTFHQQGGYMMYPMMEQPQQGYQWQQQAGYQFDNNASVDSAHVSKSKSSSTDKDTPHHGKTRQNSLKGKANGNGNNNSHYAAMTAAASQMQPNQFVPVYMLPPGFSGHPGAFNAALAAHAASQQGGQANQQGFPNVYQMPTYGHYAAPGAYGAMGAANIYPYGFPAPTGKQGSYYQPQYSGSDYNSHTGSNHTGSTPSSSHRGSRSSDSAGKKSSSNGRSLTSRDSATNSSGHHSANCSSLNNKGRKLSGKRAEGAKKDGKVKKFQSTHQIIIQKNYHKQAPPANRPAIKQNSCGRSHSIGSDLSAGCSASACHGPHQNNNLRTCSDESHSGNELLGRTNTMIPKEKRKITGCCSSECEHFGPQFMNMRKFSGNSDFKKPDAELTKKLIELIEFYLSDDYLAKDKYLLRQIRCKSEGYISIKLMTSFKKVKKLTRDWRSVRFALLQTDNLIVSPEGFRVKRATQLPENLRKPRLLSSVVTIRLTEELSSVDAITQMFSKYGEIGLVRILKPGKEIPSDLRNYATQVPDIGKSMCAVVDFEQSESALQAVRCLKDNLLEGKMRLALLGPRVRRTLYKQDKGDKDENDNEEEDLNEDLKIDTEGVWNSNPDATVEADSVRSQTQTPSYKSVVVSSQNSSTSNKIEPNQTSKTKITTKSKTVTVSRVDSSDSSLSKNLDISIDSGNCAASGTHSNDEDVANLKGVTVHFNHDEGIKRELEKKNSNSTAEAKKISVIFREPEGPGSNPEMNGFAFKRTSICMN